MNHALISELAGHDPSTRERDAVPSLSEKLVTQHGTRSAMIVSNG